jgi:hypothetical protein
MQCAHRDIQSMEDIHFRKIVLDITSPRVTELLDFVYRPEL